jgi:hypothetical protein
VAERKLPKRPLPTSPDPADLPEGLSAALRAWGRGEMTPNQQLATLSWILGDLCQIQAIDEPTLDQRLAGYTAGQRRVGMVIAKLTGVRFRLPHEKETA